MDNKINDQASSIQALDNKFDDITAQILELFRILKDSDAKKGERPELPTDAESITNILGDRGTKP